MIVMTAHDTNQSLNDNENESDSAGNDEEKNTNEEQGQSETSEEAVDQIKGQCGSIEGSEENEDDNDAEGQDNSDQTEHKMVDGEHRKDKGVDDNTKGHSQDKDTTKTIITPLTCTYHRGTRDVFAASKRQRAISSPTIKPLDKGKENMERGE